MNGRERKGNTKELKHYNSFFYTRVNNIDHIGQLPTSLSLFDRTTFCALF